jgi:hypothetical protein
LDEVLNAALALFVEGAVVQQYGPCWKSGSFRDIFSCKPSVSTKRNAKVRQHSEVTI